MLARVCLLALFVATASAFSVSSASLSLRSGRTAASSRSSPMGLRMQEQGDQPKRQGSSIDADGKANIWAVEPKMQVEDEAVKKNALLVPGLLVGGLAGILAILAATPLTNPDQL